MARALMPLLPQDEYFEQMTYNAILGISISTGYETIHLTTSSSSEVIAQILFNSNKFLNYCPDKCCTRWKTNLSNYYTLANYYFVLCVLDP